MFNTSPGSLFLANSFEILKNIFYLSSMTLWLILWMIDISFLKMKLFFYFETITASFQHLDQWLIQWMIDISFLKIKLFFFISKLLQHLSSIFQVSFKHFSSLHQHSILQTFLPIFSDPIHTPAPFQQCSRLNFCKENIVFQTFHHDVKVRKERREYFLMKFTGIGTTTWFLIYIEASEHQVLL